MQKSSQYKQVHVFVCLVQGCHIGHLPVEVMTYILKWVVSSELDVVSLENVARVCRGFYLCARDEELWRLVCQRYVCVRVCVCLRACAHACLT